MNDLVNKASRPCEWATHWAVMAAEPEAVILNEHMMTVHRPRPDGEHYDPDCGHRFPLGEAHLQLTSLEAVAESRDATKCGDCFEEAGGY